MEAVGSVDRTLLRLSATLRFVFDECSEDAVFDRLLRDDPELRGLAP
jgi:hypothetical protein